MKTLFFFLILLVFSSCLTSRPERLEAKRQRKCELAAYRWGCNLGTDSVMIITETKTIIQDTTIYVYIPGDTIKDTVPVFVDKNGLINSKPSNLKTSFASSWAQVVNGELRHNLIQNDTAIAHTIKDAIRETVTSSDTRQSKTITIEVNRLTTWQKIQLWTFRIMLSILVLILIVRRTFPGLFG